VTALPWRPGSLPVLTVDAGLAVAMAAAVTIAITVSPGRAGGPTPSPTAWGGRSPPSCWPLATLGLSVATLQVYYAHNYPGIFPALPLSVALCTAWTTGHRRWALVVAAWFLVVPVSYRVLVEETPLLQVLGDEVPDAALLATVLLLGESVRTRRELALEQQRSERLLRNVLPVPIAARPQGRRGADRRRLRRGHGAVRRHRGLHLAQVVQTLNDLFSTFDQLARRHGLEKIKTIGDAYMVVGGLPDPRPNPAQAVAEMALAMREEVSRHAGTSGRAAPGPHRHRQRPGGGRRDRYQQVQLRPVGRHRQHRQPHGISRSPRLHTSHRPHLEAA
jgi:hypothetical protein